MEGKVIMPLVSFVVPVYKAEKDLCRCLDSILNQTVSDWELILVDDGKIIGMGTHEELLKTNEMYKTLYHLELKK